MATNTALGKRRFWVQLHSFLQALSSWHPYRKKSSTESKEEGLEKPFTHARYQSVEKHTWKNQSLFSLLPQVKRHLSCQHHLITKGKWFLTLPSIKHIRQQRKGCMVQERQEDWVPRCMIPTCNLHSVVWTVTKHSLKYFGLQWSNRKGNISPQFTVCKRLFRVVCTLKHYNLVLV